MRCPKDLCTILSYKMNRYQGHSNKKPTLPLQFVLGVVFHCCFWSEKKIIVQNYRAVKKTFFRIILDLQKRTDYECNKKAFSTLAIGNFRLFATLSAVLVKSTCKTSFQPWNFDLKIQLSVL